MLEDLPYPGEELLLQITNGKDLHAFKQSFKLYRHLITDLLKSAGQSLVRQSDILDFGCGAGRLIYALRDVIDVSRVLSGCDVNERAVEWCKQLGYKSVVQNGVREPVAYAAGSFDLVIAVSVFTHLEIALQHHWAAEMLRILKPGGAVFFSVHGPSIFTKLVESFNTRPNATQLTVAHLGGDALFADLRFSGRADYDPQGQREVATAHTSEAVKKIFAGFRIAVHEPETSLAGHDLYLIVKN